MQGYFTLSSTLTLLLPFLAWLGVMIPPHSHAETPAPEMTLSLVGPGNLSFLPFDLIPRIGADRAEGTTIRLKHTDGGTAALDQLLSRNSDFAAVGLTALMMAAKAGAPPPAIAIAPVADIPLFVLIVRQALRDQIKGVADLRGRTIGVPSRSANIRTAAEQLVVSLLRAHGLETEDARIIPIGQGRKGRAILLENGEIDAIMAEEPFASAMIASGVAFSLVSLADEAPASTIPGSRFLHVTLATRPDTIAGEPTKIERMVRILRRSLTWIATHTPEEIVAHLPIPTPDEQNLFMLCLRQYPRMFSRNALFDAHQLRETERFFRHANPERAPIQADGLIDPRWTAGRVSH
ncbi:MAG: ABC transporter substrate-binding protein [Magnetococcales bacterium]|nr:ABC transporter substrate-binding protein [Magnetococcales bacterium]